MEEKSEVGILDEPIEQWNLNDNVNVFSEFPII